MADDVVAIAFEQQGAEQVAGAAQRVNDAIGGVGQAQQRTSAGTQALAAAQQAQNAQLENAGRKWGEVAGALGNVGSVVGTISPQFGTLGSVIGSVGSATTALTGALGPVGVAMAVVTTAIGVISAAMGDAEPAVGRLTRRFEEQREATERLDTSIQNTARHIRESRETFQTFFQGGASAVQETSDSVEALDRQIAGLDRQIHQLQQSGGDFAQNEIDRLERQRTRLESLRDIRGFQLEARRGVTEEQSDDEVQQQLFQSELRRIELERQARAEAARQAAQAAREAAQDRANLASTVLDDLAALNEQREIEAELFNETYGPEAMAAAEQRAHQFAQNRLRDSQDMIEAGEAIEASISKRREADEAAKQAQIAKGDQAKQHLTEVGQITQNMWSSIGGTVMDGVGQMVDFIAKGGDLGSKAFQQLLHSFLQATSVQYTIKALAEGVEAIAAAARYDYAAAAQHGIAAGMAVAVAAATGIGAAVTAPSAPSASSGGAPSLGAGSAAGGGGGSMNVTIQLFAPQAVFTDAERGALMAQSFREARRQLGPGAVRT